MKFSDLKLLVDCYDMMDNGDAEGLDVGRGFWKAMSRLHSAGLVEEHPQRRHLIRISVAGIVFVDRLLNTDLPSRHGSDAIHDTVDPLLTAHQLRRKP